MPETERWKLEGIEVVDFTVHSGASVPCAKQGTVVVPLGKIEIYAMGKVKMWDHEEYRRLQEFKQTRRMEFDNDPENEMRLEKIKAERHNYERSQEMFLSIKSVGLTDSIHDVKKLIDSLLSVGENVTVSAPTARTAEVQAPVGKLKIDSKWKILPDGTRYLSTITVVPILGRS